MANEIIVENKIPDGYPWCNKCNKPVDSIVYETPLREKPISLYRHNYFREMEHTGEVIVTVKCHGEEWKVSNQRGRIWGL
jgi:hypothetical protein